MYQGSKALATLQIWYIWFPPNRSRQKSSVWCMLSKLSMNWFQPVQQSRQQVVKTFFCNRHYPLLSSRLATTVNSQAQPFTYSVCCYGQRQLTNSIIHESITVFFVLQQKYFFHLGHDQESNPQQGALQHSKLSALFPIAPQEQSFAKNLLF